MAAVFIAGVLLSVAAGANGWAQTPAGGEAASLAAWDKIVAVLQHPRCLNCHQFDRPLQGDTRRIHIPAVVRGPDNLGAGTMRCYNCHNDRNNEMAGVPGAPHWQLAPASMLWEGKSSAELCKLLKDPALYPDPMPQAITKHMDQEKLVLWGWNPGKKWREPIPITHDEFMGLVNVWISGGLACPQQ
jgi:hypothetical protein